MNFVGHSEHAQISITKFERDRFDVVKTLFSYATFISDNSLQV